MPNPSNVASPINIHGIGRSGTTLIQNLLGRFPYIQVCNETPGLLFHASRGGELLSGSHDKESLGLPGDERVAVRAVHAVFCALLASNKPVWCQKLGGLPNTVVWETLITEADRDYAATPFAFPYAWFWRVLRQSFPLSTDLLTLRNWRDVVVSRATFSSYKPLDTLQGLAVYLNLMAHPDARIDVAYRLEELSSDPEPVMRRICDALGITFDAQCLQAMDWYAAGGRHSLGAARDAGFSWRQAYEALGPEFDAAARPLIQRPLDRIMARFGTDLAESPGATPLPSPPR